MGCSALGNLYRAMSDDDAIATVEAALAHGIGYFDVAPHYGFGMAERRLGMALAKHGGPAPLVSTKVGRLLAPTAAGGTRHGFVDADPYEPDFDYREDAVLASHEASLARLGLARVDLLLAHDLGTLTHGATAGRHLDDFLGGGYPAMRRLKETGRIDAIGIGVNEIAVCERLLDEVPLDVILLAGRYTLLEQGALPLLDRCARDGVKVIVGGPYNSGLLVEAPNGGALHYDYATAPAPAVARAQALWAACSAYAVALPAAALQFPLAHPAVTSVVAGLATPAQVADLASWTEAAIPGGLWRHLRAAGFLAPSAPTPA
ncbi:MAG: aldo/keto reductase [Sphingomonas sp.]|jgi:D-threo-aldose 1-dehydrogenase|uniref:aldo/keto reductase n=1 Tax=Sphingomonas sp. TaxID=28214 RepID=UPI003568272D